MIHETIPLPQELTTLALLVALVAVFFVAYKLMEMVFQTIIISVMSGGFYAAFSYLFLGGLPAIMDVLMFALLGSVLYIVFTLLESAYTVSKHLVKIPVMAMEAVLYPIKKLYNALKKELEKERETTSKAETSSNNQGGESSKDEDDKDTKEVVIDKVQQEDEEE